jgi:hypothetical protein
LPYHESEPKTCKIHFITKPTENILYLEGLPSHLLGDNQWKVTRFEQTHYSVTCSVLAMVHKVTLKSNPKVEAEGEYAMGLQHMGDIFKHFIVPRERKSVQEPKELDISIWSWWNIDLSSGKIKSYDLHIHRPRFIDWNDVMPPKIAIIQSICKAFGPTGDCTLKDANATTSGNSKNDNKSLNAKQDFTDMKECIAFLSQSKESADSTFQFDSK